MASVFLLAVCWCLRTITAMLLLSSFLSLATILHQSGQIFANIDGLRTTNVDQQHEIVDEHNKLRRAVQPTASNMLKMEWSNNIAINSQRWADKCILDHSGKDSRVIDGMKCGENLYMSSDPDSWRNAIQSWDAEKKDFTYGTGAKTEGAVFGHYTQVVWFKSFKVGCAIAYCPNQPKYKYYYVCQYCFAGNLNTMINTPYKSGTPCGDCPNACDNGLCTNPCLHDDDFTNCKDLTAKVGCSHPTTAAGCKSSCQCPTQIK